MHDACYSRAFCPAIVMLSGSSDHRYIYVHAMMLWNLPPAQHTDMQCAQRSQAMLGALCAKSRRKQHTLHQS